MVVESVLVILIVAAGAFWWNSVRKERLAAIEQQRDDAKKQEEQISAKLDEATKETEDAKTNYDTVYNSYTSKYHEGKKQ